MSDAIENVAYALHHAQLVGMPDVSDRRTRWKDGKPVQGDLFFRRPYPSELEVFGMFKQAWSDTSCGFGGIAGQAFTDAYTVIVYSMNENVACVYIAGRHAYTIQQPSPTFFEHVRNRQMHGARDGNLSDYRKKVK